MFTRRSRGLALFAGLCLLAILASPLAIDWFRPDKGYRKTLAGWIDPESEQVSLEDIQSRHADFVVDLFGFRYHGNTSNLIDSHVYFYGAFEKSELLLLRETLTALGPGSVMIDVGANTGIYSLFASKYAKDVHAFEPFPPVLARLRKVVEENAVGNIVIHPVALGEAEAELSFFSPPEQNLGTGSFVTGFKTTNKDEHIRLRVVAGDTYFPEANITKVDVIKMDIEGYEKAALAGLRQTVQRTRPIVLMEVSIDPSIKDLFKSLPEVKAVFPAGYEFLEMAAKNNRSGAYRLQPFQPSFDKPAQFNVVALPDEKAAFVPVESAGSPAGGW